MAIHPSSGDMAEEMIDLEAVIRRAKGQEKEYDWGEAATLYEEASLIVDQKDGFRQSQVIEARAKALYRFSFQAENSADFSKRMSESRAEYDRAKGGYQKLARSGPSPWSLRCEAMLTYIDYWTSTDVAEKTELLAEAWKLAKQSMDAFEDAGEGAELAATYEDLLLSGAILFHTKLDSETMARIVHDTIDLGDRAIRLLSEARDTDLQARIYTMATCQIDMYRDSMDLPKRDDRKVAEYWRKARELSEEVAYRTVALHASISNSWYALPMWLTDSEGGPSVIEAVLTATLRTKDSLAIGCAYDLLSQHHGFATISIDDPEMRQESSRKSLAYAKEAKRMFQVSSFVSPRVGVNWVESPETYQGTVMTSTETDPDRRKDLLADQPRLGDQLMQRAERCGYPRAVAIGHLHLNLVSTELAKLAKDPQEKKRLLQKALAHGDGMVSLHEQLAPFGGPMCGPCFHYRAVTKYELANLAEDPQTRRKMLEESISDQKRGIHLTITYGTPEVASAASRYGHYYMDLGDSLNQLHSMTKDPKDLRTAARAYLDAVKLFVASNQPGLIAECYWKVGLTRDALGDHIDASESFSAASRQYAVAAEKTPRLKAFFQDHGSYMQAWSEIELAMDHHRKQESLLSAQHYDKAAELHASTRMWSHLSTNYSAWAWIGRADDLSRKENSVESIHAFEQARQLFEESEASLRTRSGRSEGTSSDDMETSLIKAASVRKAYCRARVLVEEARILERKGDISTSHERYGSAVAMLEELSEDMSSEQEQKEMLQMLNLTRAWQQMVRAEEESSPELYAEASRLFEIVKDLSTSFKTKSLALGHSRFCLALEAGTKFADTGEAALHATASRHLESASKHYLKAGFSNVAEYANASKLLFDGYVYMDRANREENQENRARLYTMAEKVLETSASSYKKADQQAKEEQVLKLLEKVKGDKALALSLTEVLRAPDIVATTAAFSGPTPAHETAAGLDRFERADIQATVIGQPRDLRVGEEFNLDIELVNAGRGYARLTKVEQAIPHGFVVKQAPEMCRVEGDCLNMRGKRLDALKTEDVRLVLRPTAQGRFTLMPRIMYLDEAGRYRSHEPEPFDITVKELGLAGWLKGPEKR